MDEQRIRELAATLGDAEIRALADTMGYVIFAKRKPMSPEQQKERAKINRKNYYERHKNEPEWKEKRHAACKKYYDAHKEQHLSYAKQWRKENRDKVNASQAKIRERKKKRMMEEFLNEFGV